MKRGIGSQRKAKVLVMVESEKVEKTKKRKTVRRCSHIKMKVLDGLDADTFEKVVDGKLSMDATVVMDNLKGHAGVERVTSVSERQTYLGKKSQRCCHGFM